MALSILYWSNYVKNCQKLARKSENAVCCNRVLKFTLDNELQYVVGSVQASMRDRSYKVEIQLSTDDVHWTSCECPMRNFRCHHVAAILLYGYRHVSKTDVKCSWLKHPKSAPPKLTRTLSELYPSSKPAYRALPRTFDQNDRAYLYERLGSLGRFTALHWILSPEPTASHTDVNDCLIENLLLSRDFVESPSPMAWLRQAAVVSPEQIKSIAQLTCGQRENQLWALARKLRLTSSNFGAILRSISKKTRARLLPSLRKRLLSSYNLEHVAAIQWGIVHEKTALQKYQQLGAKVQETGLWLHESGVLAASPDGLVHQAPDVSVHGCGNHPQLVEVKCPYSARDKTVSAAVDECKDFFLESIDGALCLKKTSDYWHQIQGQLHITGQQCCDLFVWTSIDAQIVRVTRDELWGENLTKLCDFYFTTFLPSVLENGNVQ